MASLYCLLQSSQRNTFRISFTSDWIFCSRSASTWMCRVHTEHPRKATRVTKHQEIVQILALTKALIHQKTCHLQDLWLPPLFIDVQTDIRQSEVHSLYHYMHASQTVSLLREGRFTSLLLATSSVSSISTSSFLRCTFSSAV
jgi:hypothetical protein